MLSYSKKGVSCSPIIIDRISVTIDYKETQERAYILEQFKKLMVSDKYAWTGQRKRYKESLHLYVKDVQDRTLLIQASPWQPSHSFFRLDYNPASVDPVVFRGIIKNLLPGGWQDFVIRTLCTRVDLAVDLAGIRVDELIAHWPGMRRSRQFFASGKTLKHSHELPPLQTYEIGAYGGDRHVTFYDRVEQIKNQNKKLIVKDEVPQHSLTRIEFRLRPLVPLTNIVEIKNPFAQLKVQEFSLLPHAGDDEKHRMFMRLCQTDGAQNALLMLSEPTRKAYKKRLELTTSPWWNPEKTWAELDPALATTLKP